MLLHLAVCLGHLGLTQTYHYLAATPELMSGAACMFEGYADAKSKQLVPVANKAKVVRQLFELDADGILPSDRGTPEQSVGRELGCMKRS